MMLLQRTALLASLLSCAFSIAPQPQYILSNPALPPSTFKIPSIHDSAILAQRVLNISSIATLSTVFPTQSGLNQEPSFASTPSTQWGPPDELGGAPIGLMDYYASCAPEPRNPTILAISIATTFRNTRAGSNVTLSLRWHPPSTAPPSDDIYTYSPANMPRFSLIGYIEPISASDIKSGGVEECFLARHPDAQAWLPGNEIHESWWGRLIVQDIYWIGGFGDRAYIGWIPGKEWMSVTDREVEEARLVGEEGFETYQAVKLGMADEL